MLVYWRVIGPLEHQLPSIFPVDCLDSANPSLSLHILPILYMGVSLNGGTPKSSILIGFSIINHPFWGTPIFGNTHIVQNIYTHWRHRFNVDSLSMFVPLMIDTMSFTLPKFDKAPEKFSSQQESGLPTTIFQGLC